MAHTFHAQDPRYPKHLSKPLGPWAMTNNDLWTNYCYICFCMFDLVPTPLVPTPLKGSSDYCVLHFATTSFQILTRSSRARGDTTKQTTKPTTIQNQRWFGTKTRMLVGSKTNHQGKGKSPIQHLHRLFCSIYKNTFTNKNVKNTCFFCISYMLPLLTRAFVFEHTKTNV